MSHAELATRFFAAASSGDVDAFQDICAENMTASQNGAPPMGLPQLMAFSSAVKKAIPDFRYENARLSETETGFVEEHDVKGTLPDGEEMSLAICVVADVEDGRIVRMREYVDSYAARGLMKALS